MNQNKLDLLRQRESDLRAQIAAEAKRQQKRQWRDLDRLRGILGSALLQIAEQNPEFKRMLLQSIHGAELTAGERNFLKTQGWQ